MATQWYWLEQDHEKGPVSFQELVSMIRDHVLDEDDLVRPHYYKEWQTTDSVVGLFHMANRTPVVRQDPPPAEVETATTNRPAEDADSTRFYTLNEVVGGGAIEHLPSAFLESQPGSEETQFQNILAAADDVGADPESSEPIVVEGAMSEAIDAAAAAWDLRHGAPTSVEPTPHSSHPVIGKLAGLAGWLLMLPWRMLLAIASAIEVLFRPAVKLLVTNRRITQPLAIAVLVGVFYWNVSAMFVTQQQVYSYLDQSFTELKKLRLEEASDESWDRFQQRSLKKLASFVPKLETEADVSDPASLSLLAVSRDYLPRLLKEKSRSSIEMEHKIRTHLEVARSSLSSGAPSGSPADFRTLLLVILNLALVLGAVWLLAKSRQFNAPVTR